MDKIDSTRRSANMRAIRSRDTLPEKIVRRLVRQLGIGYRLNYPLLGKPDLVFAGRKKVIFVHGCFWHQHGCRHVRSPKSNQAYWEPKLARTKERDRLAIEGLAALGWSSLVIWECDLTDEVELMARLRNFLLPSEKK